MSIGVAKLRAPSLKRASGESDERVGKCDNEQQPGMHLKRAERVDDDNEHEQRMFPSTRATTD